MESYVCPSGGLTFSDFYSMWPVPVVWGLQVHRCLCDVWGLATGAPLPQCCVGASYRCTAACVL